MAKNVIECPEYGCVTEVSPGILWLRMPLPFDLDHINLYLIKDGQGWAAIDTGLDTPETRQAWEHIIGQLSGPITQVIVTHMHPDHVGLAGWLTERFRVPLFMTALEYYAARALVAGGQGASDWQDREYLMRAGEPFDAAKKAGESPKSALQHVVSPLPVAFKRLNANTPVRIGSDDWTVMIGRGHSPEHAALYSPSRKVLLSGDHILPGISPNIGAYSTEPEANPLADYLGTLRPFLTLPKDTLVLPAHNTPFHKLHARIEQLMTHHHKHLDNLVSTLHTPATVADSLPVLFKRKLKGRNRMFAVAECLAHLNYLLEEKRITRSVDGAGRYIYRSVAAG